MATAVTSIALRCGGDKAFLREGEDRMAAADRAMEGRFPTLLLRRSCSSVAMRRCAARAALASPAQQSATNVAASTSVCVGPFASRGLVIGREEKDKGSGGCTGSEPVSPEKLDEWMQGSVAEIVRGIGEAPFLVHVFSPSSNAGLRLEREAADADSWPHIRRRWATGAALPPDGVILVEELKCGQGDGREGEATTRPWGDEDGASSASSSSSSSKMWGVVVQGRGVDGAACYILNTCRVRSSFGFCTHFCLARAKCFGDAADVQLQKAWLLGRRHHYPPAAAGN